jgi:hypothetical protein
MAWTEFLQCKSTELDYSVSFSFCLFFIVIQSVFLDGQISLITSHYRYREINYLRLNFSCIFSFQRPNSLYCTVLLFFCSPLPGIMIWSIELLRKKQQYFSVDCYISEKLERKRIVTKPISLERIMYLTIYFISRVLVHNFELRMINADRAATLNNTTTGAHSHTQKQTQSTTHIRKQNYPRVTLTIV